VGAVAAPQRNPGGKGKLDVGGNVDMTLKQDRVWRGRLALKKRRGREACRAALKRPNGKSMDHAGVVRATGPSCRATSPAERSGAHGGKRSPQARRAPHPFRPAGRRTVRASGPCHPGLQPFETMSDWSRTERNRSPAIGETAPQRAGSAGERRRSATPATPADESMQCINASMHHSRIDTPPVFS